MNQQEALVNIISLAFELETKQIGHKEFKIGIEHYLNELNIVSQEQTQVIPNEVLASGLYLDCYVIIYFQKHSPVPSMTSNIATKEIAIMLAKEYEKEEHKVFGIYQAKDLYNASWREV